MNPVVSVVIPAHNSAATIVRALESVRAQAFGALEVIVIDDASSDDTAAVVTSWKGLPIRFLRNEVNLGAAGSRNRGILNAQGTYIAFLDADDAWLPGKLHKQVALMGANARATLVSCDCITLDEHGAVLKRTHAMHPPATGPLAWKVLLSRNFLPTPTVLVRREALQQLHGFNPDLPVAEDLDLWIRLSLAGEIAVVPEVLVEVHDQPGSLMKQHRDREEAILLSLLDQYIRRHRQSFTVQEIRGIYGQRYFKLAAQGYARGLYRSCIRLFWQAARHGHRPGKSMVNVARALLMSLLRPVGVA